MQLKWELGSPLFGLILRRYAPHDTYEVSLTDKCKGSMDPPEDRTHQQSLSLDVTNESLHL
jgi:hypothetical protein